MTAAVTLYCDHVDGLLRPCLNQYTARHASELEARLEAGALHGWGTDGTRDACPVHARETLP